MRKGDGADGQRAKVMGNFTTDAAGEEYSWSVPFLLSHSLLSTWVVEVRQCVSCVYLIVSPHIYIILFLHILTGTTDVDLLALLFQQQQVQLSHQDLVPLQSQLVSQPECRSEL